MATTGDASAMPETIDEEARRRLERGWAEGRPEALEAVVPPVQSPHYRATVEELVLIEMELAWKAWYCAPPATRCRPTPVQDYQQRFPVLDSPEVRRRLVEYERDLWLRFGNAPDLFFSSAGLALTVPDRSSVPPIPVPEVPDYEVLRELGRGGMGVVFLARDRTLNRLVALKMVRAGSFASAEERLRFLGEAQHAAALHHPNIVQVHDTGQVNGLPFFTLEYVPGGSLSERLRGQPLAPIDAARLAEKLARAVQQAHEQDLIHRDLKPANVLIEEGPDTPPSAWTPKITDFGLARHLQAGDGLTQTGAIIGTPSYMAPEQAAGKSKAISPATDVYALGAILYELLTGRPPFQAATAMEVVQQVLDDEPLPPTRLYPRLPRDLATICLKCLSKEPARRYARAADLADELGRFLKGQPILARPLGRAGRLWLWCRRNPLLASVAAAALVAAAAVVSLSIGFAWHQTRAAELLRRQQQQTDNARRQAEDLVTQLRETDRQRLRFTHLAARLVLGQGQTRAEQGDVPRGMLVLARGLQLTPPDAQETATALRTALSAWLGRLHPLRAILPHREMILAVAFSPDGKTFVTGGKDRTAQLWSAATGAPIGPALQHKGWVRVAAFSPSSKVVLTAGTDGMVRLWDTTTAAPVAAFAGHKGWIGCATFSPDGRTILTGSYDGTAQLWDASTHRPIGSPLRHRKGMVRSIAFHRDGKLILTAGDDGTARLWDAGTGNPVGTVMQHDGNVVQAVFSPDSQVILTACLDARGSGARLWDAGGKLLRVLPHETGASNPAFRPDGKVALTVSSRMAQLWDVSTGQRIGAPLRHLDHIEHAAFSPDGKTVLTSSSDWTARLWDAATGEPLGPPLRHPDPLRIAAFSPDGQTMLIAAGATARLWQAALARPGPLALPHRNIAMGAAFSPDGTVALTGCWDGLAQRWDAVTGRPHGEPLRHPHRINSVSFSPDGRTILTAGYGGEGAGPPGMAQLWDAATGRPTRIVFPHRAGVFAAAFSPNGQLVLTGSHDHTAQLWDAATGARRGAPLKQRAAIWGVAFSPDGKAALTGGFDSPPYLWDLTGSERPGRPLRQSPTVWGVAFSPDGTRIATGCWDHRARVMQRSTGQPLGAPLEHEDWVYGVTFSPDSRVVLTASSDGTARLWDALTGQQLGPSLRHKGEVYSVAFSPDGQRILTCGGDRATETGVAFLWPGLIPLAGDAERLTLWVQVVTGQELDDEGVAHWLDAASWRERRQRLHELGGPPF